MLWNGENLDFKRFLGIEKVHRNFIKITVDFLAEKEGFEPSIPFWGIHDFQSCALGQLRDFSKCCRLVPTCI